MEELGRQGIIWAQWKSTMDLGFVRIEAFEWEGFCRALKHAIIFPTDSPDELV